MKNHTKDQSVKNKKFNIKFLLFLIPVIAVIAYFGQAGCAVVLGNEVVAVAADRETAQEAVQEYLSRLEKDTGLPVNLEEEIKYRPTWKFAALTDKEEIKKRLSNEFDGVVGTTGIYVDGKMVVAVEDLEAGKKVLKRLLHTYDSQDSREVSFKQKVELKPVALDGANLLSIDDAVEFIRFGGTKSRAYTVKPGDTLWDIASAVQISVEKLQQANPGLKPETIQIDQEIKISETSPLIDVKTIYQETRQEEILYRVHEKVSKNLFLGERSVVQRGQSGEREVIYNITLENGVETDKEVVKEKIIKEPVPQIVAKGNRKLLAFRGGNGRLAYPAAGGIVSPFGQRWGRAHEGVDIGANYGSPVVAAEAGTVLRAGNYGGYGLCIDISHGNGVVTRYAHLSSKAVNSGQRVERGQFIGRTGSSGNSTGPHLHFEVIVNGVHKNPSLFI